MTVRTNPLIDDYLRRLAAAAGSLPKHRRDELVAEIREHVEEAMRQTPTDDEAGVRNLLERLGRPEEIVDAASDPELPPHPVGAVRETNSLAVASVVLGVLWLLGIGSALAIALGYRARREIRNADVDQKGSVLATVGIVLGWIGIAMLLAVVVGGLGFIGASRSGPVPLPSP